MGKREVSILESASDAVAEVAFFIESKGMLQTAKKFVDEAFEFFGKLSDDRIVHKLCSYKLWQDLNYRCVSYKNKFTVAYLLFDGEIIICGFVVSKLIH